MTIDERAGKTLGELGVTDHKGVDQLFAEARKAIEDEREKLVSAEMSEVEFYRAAKFVRDRWLSRENGLVHRINVNWLSPAAKAMKPVVGHRFNEFRRFAAGAIEVEKILEKRQQIVKYVAAYRDLRGEKLPELALRREKLRDLTLPGYRRPLGSIHPITRVQREIEDIFLGLGFSIEAGPEVETVYYNFDALNIPESHPSRDDVDTIYIDSQTVLRTHTSPVQIRAMEEHGAPLYIVIPGKCYRHDKPDASHSPMFHQMEGLAIDVDITFADLKGTLDFFAKKLLGDKVRTSLRPSFFPFTEPSGEVAASCPICDGRGCRTCKESGWVELGGCGMVHPEVLRNGGIDPDRYSGWAFGLGIDRYAMMKYGIDDIQLFFQSDLRFLEQF